MNDKMKTAISIIAIACLCACTSTNEQTQIQTPRTEYTAPPQQTQIQPARTPHTAPAQTDDGEKEYNYTDEDWGNVRLGIQKLTDEQLLHFFSETDRIHPYIAERLTRGIADNKDMNILRLHPELRQEITRRGLWKKLK